MSGTCRASRARLALRHPNRTGPRLTDRRHLGMSVGGAYRRAGCGIGGCRIPPFSCLAGASGCWVPGYSGAWRLVPGCLTPVSWVPVWLGSCLPEAVPTAWHSSSAAGHHVPRMQCSAARRVRSWLCPIETCQMTVLPIETCQLPCLDASGGHLPCLDASAGVRSAHMS